MTEVQLPTLPGEVYVLAPHLPALAEEIVVAIAAEVPSYARPLERGSRAVQRGVEGALAEFVDLSRGGAVARGAVAADLGRREVRAGRSLDALLSAYRTGARVAWRRLAALGLAAGLAPETLVLLAEAIFAYVDELSAESAEGFAREQAERAGELERRRRALAELLVAAPAPDAGAVAAAADTAHWRLPAAVVVAVWREEAAPPVRATSPPAAPTRATSGASPRATSPAATSAPPAMATTPPATATSPPATTPPATATTPPAATATATTPPATATTPPAATATATTPPAATATATSPPAATATSPPAGTATAATAPPTLRAGPALPADALRATVEGLGCAVLSGPPRELLSALEGRAAGVGPAVPVGDAARSFRLACAALSLAEERGLEAPLAVDAHRFDLLSRAEPSLVAALAAERLAPLAGETVNSRARLEATLLAWLRHAGSVAEAARELGVHPQTVRYRLGRLRELLGDALDDPDARFELELVLRAR